MKLTRLVPAAVAAVALLAGCSPTPGTALVMDGTRYTEAQLDEIVDGCAEALAITPDQIRRAGVVGTLVLGGVFDSIGADVAEADLETAADQMGSGQLFSVDSCRPLALANTKVQMLSSIQDQEAVMEAAGKMDVQLNPRYGKWAPHTGTLLEPSGSLSVPTVAFQ